MNYRQGEIEKAKYQFATSSDNTQANDDRAYHERWANTRATVFYYDRNALHCSSRSTIRTHNGYNSEEYNNRMQYNIRQ